MEYNFKAVEPKWQKKWEEAGVFHAEDRSDKPKYYALVEFPYPSGAGMHVGHIKAYSGLEVLSRKRRLQGYNVLFPIGFDAYGLPTENYAIKTGIHPRKVTDTNIAKFTSQLKKSRLLVRLDARHRYDRGRLLQMDAVDLPEDV